MGGRGSCVKEVSCSCYCECYKTLNFHCWITFIQAINRIALSQIPNKLTDYLPLKEGKAPPIFCLCRYFGGWMGLSGEHLHIRNTDSPQHSSFISKAVTPGRGMGQVWLDKWESLFLSVAILPWLSAFLWLCQSVSPLCFFFHALLSLSSPLGCLCHFLTAHYSNVPSPLIFLYVLAKWHHNSQWQTLEHPEKWLTPETLFNLDRSLY